MLPGPINREISLVDCSVKHSLASAGDRHDHGAAGAEVQGEDRAVREEGDGSGGLGSSRMLLSLPLRQCRPPHPCHSLGVLHLPEP